MIGWKLFSMVLCPEAILFCPIFGQIFIRFFLHNASTGSRFFRAPQTASASLFSGDACFAPTLAFRQDMKSPIRWAGSKTQLLPSLRKFWGSEYQRYIEPFAGSASLFFDIKPANALLGDLNWELISALQALKRDAELVLQCLLRLPRGRRSYYRIRKQDPAILSPAERSARFFYLNRFCFNGLYRTNLKGQFNVPYG